jgi:2-oxoglutarate dehydrogenase E1 component
MLAFASLVARGTPVRLSGQDSGRGTFSQRHAIWVDQTTGAPFVPLNHLIPNQALFEICDSPLSEVGVLGFEYGYSITKPQQLVLWEAQFGDFANGAAVLIDQYIAAGEAKWGVPTGVVLLLPHGYEGQGPEHSSGRLERFLQLYADHNIIVANCTTPANYFHLLRRQVVAPYRKPLVVMTPKSLLRHKLAVSTLKDMTKGKAFQPVLGDLAISPKLAQRVILCSGKIYYDLLEQRKDQPIALIRLEQLAPFPKELILKALKAYAHAEIVWCQEEPKNMGAWSFVAEHMEEVLTALHHTQMRPFYMGRPAAASPATGFPDRHAEEIRRLLDTALTLTKFQKRKVSYGH